MMGFGDRTARIVVASDAPVPWLRMPNVNVAESPGASMAVAGTTDVNARSGTGMTTATWPLTVSLRPAGSVAVTSIVAEPPDTPAIVTSEPETETAATAESDEDAS